MLLGLVSDDWAWFPQPAMAGTWRIQSLAVSLINSHYMKSEEDFKII
jgi:hypothetical protein